jgi:hypothetical protein
MPGSIQGLQGYCVLVHQGVYRARSMELITVLCEGLLQYSNNVQITPRIAYANSGIHGPET